MGAILLDGKPFDVHQFDVIVQGGKLTEVYLRYNNNFDDSIRLAGYLVQQEEYEEFVLWQKVHGRMEVVELE